VFERALSVDAIDGDGVGSDERYGDEGMTRVGADGLSLGHDCDRELTADRVLAPRAERAPVDGHSGESAGLSEFAPHVR
jgi:hypothetical protein